MADKISRSKGQKSATVVRQKAPVSSRQINYLPAHGFSLLSSHFNANLLTFLLKGRDKKAHSIFFRNRPIPPLRARQSTLLREGEKFLPPKCEVEHKISIMRLPRNRFELEIPLKEWFTLLPTTY